MKDEKTEETEVAEFQIGDLLGIGITFIVLVIALAFGLDMVEDTQTDIATSNLGVNCGQNATGGSTGIVYTGCGSAYNSTIDG